MTRALSSQPFTMPNMAWYVACLLAGLAGNSLHFPLFLNIDFLFGSIFAMLALQVFGPVRGVLAAALISSYTWWLWNHPYAIIIMTLEAAVAGLLHRRFKMNLVLADALYWLCLGMPLVYLFFGVIMQAEASYAVIMGKLAINGLANTLAACLLYMGYGLVTTRFKPSSRAMLTNLLASFVLFPALLMLLASARQDYAEAEQRLQTSLQAQSRQLTSGIEQWLEQRQTAMVNLAAMVQSLPMQQIKLFIEELLTLDKTIECYCILDDQTGLVATAPPLTANGQPSTGVSLASQPYLSRLRESLAPLWTGAVEAKEGTSKPVVLVIAPLIEKGQYAGSVGGRIDLTMLAPILATGCAPDTRYVLLDQHDQVMLSSYQDLPVMTPFTRSNGRMAKTAMGMDQWIAHAPKNIPVSERWRQSVFVLQTPLQIATGWKLILETPVKTVQQQIYASYAQKLGVLFATLLLALACAELFSRRFVMAMESLCRITRDLSAQLGHEEAPRQWPGSRMLETSQLIETIQQMSDQLQQQFAAVQLANLRLEHEVEQRTQSLRASTGLYQTLTAHVPVGIFQANGQGEITIVNQACLDLTGLPEAAILGQGWHAAVHPEDREEVVARWNQAIAQEQDFFSHEFRYQTPAGKVNWVYGIAKRLAGDNRQATRYTGCIIDFTARHQAETALRESMANLNNLVTTTGDLIVVASVNGWIQYTNPAVHAKLGFSESELKQMHLLDLHAPEHREEAETICAALARGEQPSSPFPLQTKTGALLPVETRIWHGRWNDQDCLFVFNKDLSEEQEGRQLFERVFHNNPNPMALTLIPDRHFVDVNTAFTKTLGYTKEELRGKSSLDVGLFADPQYHQTFAGRLFSEGRVNAFEVQARCKDNTIIDGLLSGEIIRTHGREYVLTVLIDISERIRAAKAMEAMAYRYQLLLQTGGDGIHVLDEDGYIVEVNDAFCAMLGYSREEMQQLHVADWDSQWPSEELMAILQETLALRHPRLLETRHRRKDGQFRDVEIQMLGFHLDGQHLVYASARDITERKRAVAALQLRESYLSAIIETQPGPVWLKDLASRFLAVNTKFAKACGLDDPALVAGKSDFDVWPAGLAARYFADDLKVLVSRECLTVEEPVVDQGQTRWFQTFKTPVINAGGSVLGTTGFALDITERRKAEAALHESEARLSAAIRIAQLGVYASDFVSGQVYYSPEFLALFGLASDATLATDEDNLPRAIHPEDRQALLALMRQASDPCGTGLLDHEYRIIHPDGSVHWLRIIGQTFFSGQSAQDQPLRATGIVQDLTGRKIMEETLRISKEEALAADQAKSKLLLTVAHEFRTPLTLLTSSLDILERYNTRLSAEQRRTQEMYLRSASRQLRLLVDSVLTYTNAANNKKITLTIPFDIADLCQLIARETEAAWSQGQRFVTVIPDNLGITALDETLFHRIVKNLLTNAFQYTPVDGSISFRVSRHEQVLHLEIADTGIGIAPDEQQAVFTPFFRGQNVGGQRGMGLGLNLVQEALHKLGGTLTLTSELGQGTTIQVDLSCL